MDERPDLEAVGQARATLLSELLPLRQRMAEAAQQVYDDWQQDEDGIDEELGSGGICTLVSNALSAIVAESIADLDLPDAGADGDDHAWFFAVRRGTREAVEVDIDHRLYERGGGYSWRKIPGVVFSAEDVLLAPFPFEEIERELELDPDLNW